MLDNDSPINGRRYKGYIIDLMDEISRTLNFSYHIKVVADNQYGVRYQDINGHPKWTGIVGEIVDGVSIANQYSLMMFTQH